MSIYTMWRAGGNENGAELLLTRGSGQREPNDPLTTLHQDALKLGCAAYAYFDTKKPLEQNSSQQKRLSDQLQKFLPLLIIASKGHNEAIGLDYWLLVDLVGVLSILLKTGFDLEQETVKLAGENTSVYQTLSLFFDQQAIQELGKDLWSTGNHYTRQYLQLDQSKEEYDECLGKLLPPEHQLHPNNTKKQTVESPSACVLC